MISSTHPWTDRNANGSRLSSFSVLSTAEMRGLEVAWVCDSTFGKGDHHAFRPYESQHEISLA
jgi:hypothetical protein